MKKKDDIDGKRISRWIFTFFITALLIVLTLLYYSITTTIKP